MLAFFPTEDPRPFSELEGTIEKTAEGLSEYILIPTKPVEPSIDFIIKSLRESATYLLNGLRHLSGPDLEDLIGEDVFKNILQYKKEEYPVKDLRTAAAFILLNQLLFYQVLSRKRPHQLPEVKICHNLKSCNLTFRERWKTETTKEALCGMSPKESKMRLKHIYEAETSSIELLVIMEDSVSLIGNACLPDGLLRFIHLFSHHLREFVARFYWSFTGVSSATGGFDVTSGTTTFDPLSKGLGKRVERFEEISPKKSHQGI